MDLLSNLEFWKHLSIPAVAAFVGWSTNWLAIKLMFSPIEYTGYRPLSLGWQGIIPSRAEQMAKVVVEKGMASLADIDELYEAIDRKKLVNELVKIMSTRLEFYIDELMDQENATIWENLPYRVKQRVYSSVHKQLPGMVKQMVRETGNNLYRYFDLEAMVIHILTEDKTLLNRIFQQAGKQEFKFIVNSGIYFGFVFGIIQALVWFVYPEWWILPLFGLFVGYATNAIALKVIFKPLYPVSLGPLSIQGLFLKRQKEISNVFCKITTREILTINNILTAMLIGPKKLETRRLIQSHIRRAIDQTKILGVNIGKPIIKGVMGTRNYIDLKDRAGELAYSVAKEEILTSQAFNKGQTEIIEKLLRERMEALTPEEFQGILRPAFQADEWKLVAVGGALGLATGFIQLFGIFDGI